MRWFCTHSRAAEQRSLCFIFRFYWMSFRLFLIAWFSLNYFALSKLFGMIFASKLWIFNQNYENFELWLFVSTFIHVLNFPFKNLWFMNRPINPPISDSKMDKTHPKMTLFGRESNSAPSTARFRVGTRSGTNLSIVFFFKTEGNGISGRTSTLPPTIPIGNDIPQKRIEFCT